ncbi:MAG: hypothetical protein LIP05_13390 [Tannerellaceae bacterium]|nr:hypothetical protein [Tannerellaceae bacterium]
MKIRYLSYWQGDIKMTSYYKEMMDNDRTYIGSIHGSFDHTPDHELIPQAYFVVQQFMTDVEKNTRRYWKQPNPMLC